MDIETRGSSNIQLHDIRHDRLDDDGLRALPPVDGGRDAWLVLAGGFLLEATVWGFPFAVGVIQTYYLSHEPFKSEPAGIAAISTTGSGIMYLSSPFVAILLQQFPRLQRPMAFIGLATMCAALIGASFSNSVGALVATQGVLYGVGGLALYFPAMFVIDQWFVARKGFAFGIVWTGTGVSGVVMPFLFQWMLDSYGFRVALRIWTIILVVLSLPAIFMVRPRIPPSHTSRMRPLDLSFTKRPSFWILQFSTFTQSLAFFLPQLWIPSFAASMGFPSFSGALALALLNLAACGGYLLIGVLVDHMEMSVVILLSALVSAFSIFVFWGLTVSQAMLYVFAIFWGLSGGGYAATWSGCARAMDRRQHPYRLSSSESYESSIDTGLVIGLMAASKGLGSIISGPISEELIRSKTWKSGGSGYGSEYGNIIIFGGVMALCSGSAFLGRLLKVL